MPDQAHNALITTKASASTLERGGIQSEEILSLLREAQMAYDRRNYRVVLDLTSQAKDRMLALKARQSAKGDLGKLEGIAAPEGTEETTTKELLQKEFPPNFAQARFTIGIAPKQIASWPKPRAASMRGTTPEPYPSRARPSGPPRAWLPLGRPPRRWR